MRHLNEESAEFRQQLYGWPPKNRISDARLMHSAMRRLLRGAWVQRTQDLVTGGTLPVTGDRTALRFRRVDPQAPGLMPPQPIGP